MQLHKNILMHFFGELVSKLEEDGVVHKIRCAEIFFLKNMLNIFRPNLNFQRLLSVLFGKFGKISKLSCNLNNMN
jgi:hypothetical protein